MAKRVCLRSGYKFEFEGKRNWRSSKDERWETIMKKAVCGKQLGNRRVDGSVVVVVKAGGKIYAALPTAVMSPKRKR